MRFDVSSFREFYATTRTIWRMFRCTQWYCRTTRSTRACRASPVFCQGSICPSGETPPTTRRPHPPSVLANKLGRTRFAGYPTPSQFSTSLLASYILDYWLFWRSCQSDPILRYFLCFADFTAAIFPLVSLAKTATCLYSTSSQRGLNCISTTHKYTHTSSMPANLPPPPLPFPLPVRMLSYDPLVYARDGVRVVWTNTAVIPCQTMQCDSYVCKKLYM